MALEEFIIDLCEESVNGALLTFWLFQTYLHDLASAPNSIAFKTCRRIYNRVQRIVFGSAEPQRREKIKENILPVTVLSSLVLASIAAPFLPAHAGPLAIAQARKPRPIEDIISDNVQTAKVGRSKTVTGGSPRTKQRRTAQGHSDPEDSRLSKAASPRPTESREQKDLRRQATRPPNAVRTPSAQHRPSLLAMDPEARLSSSSLPDFRDPAPSPLPTPPATAGLGPKPDHHVLRKHHALPPRPLTPTALSRTQKIRLLRSNYFRSETQFLSALEDISNRLVIVPKPARLSALRAELALIAQDLPAEVDIPTLSPPTLKDGIASQSQHHRIVRINPAEATSLNSAERVPYLLMVEVLQEDFDFDPDTQENQQLLEKLMFEKGTSRRRLFDITNAEYLALDRTPPNGSDSVFEPATGDLSSTSLIGGTPEEDISSGMARVTLPSATASTNGKATAPRSSSGANTLSSMATLSTPRTSDSAISRSNSPVPARRMTIPANMSRGADQPDFSALATHMRTAAQMLAQLEASGSKRPKTEVAAIKAKIIASMQSLEEQNFMAEEQGPTFDTIMAEADPTSISAEPEEIEETLAGGTNSGAGAARMENDLKTGGMRRKGDRDDPSAATFGEEWSAKRERIRRSSPYGQMKNWDLISVIVKTGADLRQEAFACQLIQVCTRIWEEANVPVWTKRMRILVTGESSGLIETITNGVSLHSLKRSLTLASIAAGTNPRKRIATLQDHWRKTFGEPESDAYIAGVNAFTRSLAAYSMISYVLQLKDRHNGNLLIDNMGHIIHIDFGFMLSNSPGSMGFEAAPFKLTQEYVDVLGGLTSPAFEEFKALCKRAFQALRKEAERLIMLVDLMSKQSKMDCFKAGAANVTNSLRARLMLHLSREEAETFVDELIAKSVGSYYTRLYDTFQYRTQGIY
ncbi:kinase-like domain-containing protein [Phaeosphaeria sp. MPI-PUGE-AT-0046c]|nr:kinase-like domain-containing protein [Phaeosphaeria sp. MPI-PUGE-AT-0046c]